MIYLIVLLGLVLRLISINQSLWLDEATTALVAKMSVGDIFTKFLPGDFHPPLYYLVLKYWTNIFGYSEISLRIPSVIFGLATIYLTYLIAKELFNKRVGLVSALLTSTSGLLIYYSQEARMYSLAAFLVSLSVYLFLKKKWVWFSIVLALIFLTDYVSLLILPVFWLLSFKNWKKLVLSHFPLGLTFIIWLPNFLNQLSRGLAQEGTRWWMILGVSNFKNIALIPVKFVLGRISFDNKVIYAITALVAVSLFSFLVYKARKSSKTVTLWLFLPIILGILLSFKIPTLVFFRFIFCLPAFYILTAFGMFEFSKRWKVFLFLTLTVNLLSSFYYLLNSKFQREDWRLLSKTLGNQTIVLPFYSQTEALKYYDLEDQIVLVDQLSSNKENSFWLSRYVWDIFDPNDLARKKIESLGYNKVEEVNFNGVVLFRYETKGNQPLERK